MIVTSGLTKRFGEIEAVSQLSFTARAGTIFGLLGPNGAGKTTAIRMLATVLTPTAGTATVAGYDIVREPEAVRGAIGVLTAEIGLYDRYTARENLRYFGQLYGMRGANLEGRIDALLQQLEMTSFADRRAGKFSTGMKQKVAIARSIVHDPAVVIFDEPTSGLDVLAAQTVVQMMEAFRRAGKLVILSTHDMDAADRLCDEVAILHRGRLVAAGAVADIKQRTGTQRLEEAFLAIIGEGEAKAAVTDAERAALHKSETKKRWGKF